MISDREATEVGLEGARGCFVGFCLIAAVFAVVAFIIYAIAS